MKPHPLAGIDAYLYGYALLGFAGPGIQICLLHMSMQPLVPSWLLKHDLGNLFQKNSTVISCFSGMFGASSVVFKVFEVCCGGW